MTQQNEQLALALAIKSMRENLPAWLEYASLDAQRTRAQYLALVKSGFTETQAIQLCKKS